MDKKKGKAKPVKPTKSMIEVVNKEYESHLDLKKSKVKPKIVQLKGHKYVDIICGTLDAPVLEKADTITSGDGYYVIDTTIGSPIKFFTADHHINKKPVKKTKPPTTVKKKKNPATVLKIKKAPPPRKPYSRIIREEDFKFPRVRKQNTLRVEREPQVRMEEDEFRDIEALEIKIG